MIRVNATAMSATGKAGLLLAPLLLCGCAITSSHDNALGASALIQAQTGRSVTWRRTHAADAELLGHIDGLLAGGLTAQKSVAVALLASPEVQIALERLEISRADLVAASTVPNPVIVAGVRDSGGNLASFYPGRNVTVGFLQNVLALLNMPGRRHIARIDLDRARYEAADRIIGLAAEVNQAFLEYVAAQRVTELRERGATAAHAARDLIAGAVSSGQDYSPLDLAQERNSTFSAEVALVRARMDLATARAHLAQLMGIAGVRDEWATVEELPSLPASDPDPHALEPLAIQQRLDLQAARQALASRLLVLSTTRHFRWLGGLELGLFRESTSGGTHFIGPNAVVELPLFDQHQSQLLSADAEVREAMRTIESLTQTARNELRTHAAEMSATRQLVEQYRDVVLPNQREIGALMGKEGDPETVDRLHQRQSALSTQEDAVGALRDYWRARAALARAAGDYGALIGWVPDGPALPAPAPPVR